MQGAGHIGGEVQGRLFELAGQSGTCNQAAVELLRGNLVRGLSTLPPVAVGGGDAGPHISIAAPEMSWASSKVAERGMFAWVFRPWANSDKVLRQALGPQFLELMSDGRDRCVFWKMWSKGLLEVRSDQVVVHPPATPEDRKWLGHVFEKTHNGTLRQIIWESFGLTEGSTLTLNLRGQPEQQGLIAAPPLQQP